MKQAISITKQEIEWHEQNKSEAPSMIQAESFIKGLKHLLDLFQQCEASQPQDVADSKYPCGCYPNSDIVVRGKNQCLCGIRR